MTTDEIILLKINRLYVSLWIDTDLTNGVLGVSFLRPYKNYTTADYHIGLHFLVFDVFFTLKNKANEG